VRKLNLDAVGIWDEQLGRVATPRYLGTAGTEVGKTAHHALGIEIRNRHAIRKKIGLCATPRRRQSKKVRTLADTKYDRFALLDRRTEQPLLERRRARHIRTGDHPIVQASGLNHRSHLLSHHTR